MIQGTGTSIFSQLVAVFSREKFLHLVVKHKAGVQNPTFQYSNADEFGMRSELGSSVITRQSGIHL